MTTQSIINELTIKGANGTFTALDNQVAKLSKSEMELYAKANNKGITGEDALAFVFKSFNNWNCITS
jgi:hypothetical protein